MLEIVLSENFKVLHQVVNVEESRALVDDDSENTEVGFVFVDAHLLDQLVLLSTQVLLK